MLTSENYIRNVKPSMLFISCIRDRKLCIRFLKSSFQLYSKHSLTHSKSPPEFSTSYRTLRFPTSVFFNREPLGALITSCFFSLLVKFRFWTWTVWLLLLLLLLFNGDCVNMLTFNVSVTVLTSESFFLSFFRVAFFFDGYYSTYNWTFLTWFYLFAIERFFFLLWVHHRFLFRVVAAWMIDWFGFFCRQVILVCLPCNCFNFN